MVIKILKAFLLFLTIILLLLLVLVVKPNSVFAITNIFTPYNIQTDDIALDFIGAKLQITGLGITEKQTKNTYSFDEIAISSGLTLKINQADIVINKFKTTDNKTKKLPNITIDKLNFTYQNIMLNASIIMQNNKLTASVDEFIYDKNILKKLPNTTTTRYLKRALKQVKLQDVKLIFDNKNQEFLISGVMQDLILNPHKNWQQIQAQTVDFSINAEKIILDLKQGTMGNLDISNNQVIVDWNNNKSVQVKIDKIATTAEVVKFLLNSPIRNNLKATFDRVSATGVVDANIYLEFYFDKEKADIINIKTKLVNNQVVLFDKIKIQDFNGDLTFNNILNIVGKGQIKQQPFALELNYQNTLNASIEIANSIVSISNYDDWLIKIFHPQLIGDISLNFDKQIPQVLISNVVVDIKDDNTTNNINLTISDLEDFILTTNNITIGNYKMPNLTATIDKIDNTQINIDNLQIAGLNVDNSQIIFNGTWRQNSTELHTEISGDSLSSLFNSLNIKQKVSDSSFDAKADLFCACNPWQLNLANMLGNFHITTNNGIIYEKTNVFSKLLSLLSIKSLSKRLKLEVDDLTTSGFAYNQIKGDITLNDGIAAIDNFNLTSDVADIVITGTSNIINKQHNLNAEVTPQLKDSLPIATYLAGGGLAGLGVWLVDKTIFDEKLINSFTDEIVKFDYKITGPWDNPTIK
jgi:uncharacterized protein YhdP